MVTFSKGVMSPISGFRRWLALSSVVSNIVAVTLAVNFRSIWVSTSYVMSLVSTNSNTVNTPSNIVAKTIGPCFRRLESELMASNVVSRSKVQMLKTSARAVVENRSRRRHKRHNGAGVADVVRKSSNAIVRNYRSL